MTDAALATPPTTDRLGVTTPATTRRRRSPEVEQYGIEPIPDADRTATPFDLFRVAFGGANTFATARTTPCRAARTSASSAGSSARSSRC